MAFRSYMLAGLREGAGREDVVAVVRELETLPEVLFAEPVIGAYDLVITVETSEPVEEVARRLQTIDHLEQVTPLKVNPVPARERMWKNLDKIPSRA